MANRPFRREGLFHSAEPLVFAKAKELRNTMTDAERVLWYHLKGGVDGLKFRRQHPLGCYIVDFYCHKAKLVIEVDGSIHDVKEVKLHDEQKERDLKANGYTVLRFTSKKVMSNVADVLDKIKLATQTCLNNNH